MELSLVFLNLCYVYRNNSGRRSYRLLKQLSLGILGMGDISKDGTIEVCNRLDNHDCVDLTTANYISCLTGGDILFLVLSLCVWFLLCV